MSQTPELHNQASRQGCYLSFDTYLTTEGVDFLTRDERREAYSFWKRFYKEHGGTPEGLEKVKRDFHQQLLRLPHRKKSLSPGEVNFLRRMNEDTDAQIKSLEAM